MLTIAEILELTGYNESSTHLALGWLSKEDKIHFTYKDDVLYVELNHSVSEMYH